MIRLLSYIMVSVSILFSCKKESKIKVVIDSKKDLYFKRGEYLYTKNNDSAFIYFNNALLQYKSIRDSANIVKCLIYQSLIQIQEGDFYGSDENSIAALKFANHQNTNKLSLYNNLAITRKNLKDYKTAILWYNKALNASKIRSEKFIIENNIAVAYSKSKNYQKAISILENLLKNKDLSKNISTQSKIIDNLAFTRFLQNKNYNAESELMKVLQIREKENDLWGQNASQAHLADYFTEKKPQTALMHAEKMYTIATKLKSPDDRLEALQKLIQLDPKNYQKHFSQFTSLNDSLQTARNKAKNQFALIRYDAEKNRADYLKSKAENSQKQNKILKQYIALGVLSLGLIIGYWWYRKRKKRLEQEKILEVKETELKYSKKVHDVVANSVYQVLNDVENSVEINKEKLLYKLENIYEKSRDITYEEKPTLSEDFTLEMYKLVNSFSSDEVKIILSGNTPETWQNYKDKTKSEILLIVRELLVNMKKHSKANWMSIKFENTPKQLRIAYFDNGIGLPKENFAKKNGLQNTESRISSLRGSLIFDENIEKGTKIIIKIPS